MVCALKPLCFRPRHPDQALPGPPRVPSPSSLTPVPGDSPETIPTVLTHTPEGPKGLGRFPSDQKRQGLRGPVGQAAPRQDGGERVRWSFPKSPFYFNTGCAPKIPLPGLGQVAGHSQHQAPSNVQREARARDPMRGVTGPRPGVPGSLKTRWKLGAHWVELFWGVSEWPGQVAGVCRGPDDNQRQEAPGLCRRGGSGAGPDPCPLFAPPALQNKLLELNSERCR